LIRSILAEIMENFRVERHVKAYIEEQNNPKRDLR